MYQVKNFNLLGLPGLSDKLLQNHRTLYEGYVKNFSKLNDILLTFEKAGKYDTPEYAELNRRFGWEFNGMRLHELYFEVLIKPSGSIPIIDRQWALSQMIEKEFGTFEAWQKDFTSLGAIRGIGWVILYYDKLANRLFNVWINEHDIGHLAGAVPLLVMDVFEHAYMLDYGLKKVDYIATFMNLIDWTIIQKRFEEGKK